MNKLYQNVIQNGGEGIMIKDPESLYEGKRSHYMLKYKPCFDAEESLLITKMVRINIKVS